MVLATWKGWMVLATQRWCLVLVDSSHIEQVGESHKKRRGEMVKPVWRVRVGKHLHLKIMIFSILDITHRNEF